MAKSKGNKPNPETKKSKGGATTPPPGVRGTGSSPETLWGSQIPVEQVAGSLPGFAESKLPKTAAGIDAYLRLGGMGTDAILDYATRQNGVAEMLAAVVQPESGFKPPAVSVTESNVQGASTATDATADKPRAPKTLTPRKLEAMVGGAARGLGNAGEIKRGVVETPGVRMEFRTRRKAPATEAAATGEAAAGQTEAQGQGQQQTQQAQPKELPPLEEAIAAAKQKWKDKGVDPPKTIGLTTAAARNWPNIALAVGGLTGLGAFGYGLASGLSGGGQAQPQQAPTALTPEQIQAARERKRAMYGIPPDAPQQPVQPPARQDIPAGTPPDNNSTLLMRLQQSRMV